MDPVSNSFPSMLEPEETGKILRVAGILSSRHPFFIINEHSTKQS